MKYFITQVSIYFSKLSKIILYLFDLACYYTKNSLHIIKSSEKTKAAGYHVKKAGKNLISKTKENAWNWNHRLSSSESFRIFEEDV